MTGEEVERLWTDIGLVSARDIDEGWALVLRRLGSWLDTSETGCSVVSQSNGRWRVVRAFGEVQLECLGARSLDPVARRYLAEAGSHRATKLSNPEWGSTACLRALQRSGRVDRVVATHALDEQAEVHFVFDHVTPFHADADVITRRAMPGLRRLCYWLALSVGAWESPLTNREREALMHLLGPKSEKEGAAAMGLTTGSFHQLVVSVYRKIGVRSRAELMSLWLSHDRPTNP